MANKSSELLYTKLKQKVSVLYDSNQILFTAAAFVATFAASLGVRKIVDICYRKLKRYPPGMKIPKIYQ